MGNTLPAIKAESGIGAELLAGNDKAGSSEAKCPGYDDAVRRASQSASTGECRGDTREGGNDAAEYDVRTTARQGDIRGIPLIPGLFLQREPIRYSVYSSSGMRYSLIFL